MDHMKKRSVTVSICVAVFVIGLLMTQNKLNGQTTFQSSGTQAGDQCEQTMNGVKYVFRWCPPGEFVMGSPVTEKDRNNDEIQHQVKLTRGFWILETEVTQEMWKSVMGNNPSCFKGNKNPVEKVSWEDCQKYLAKLNEQAPNGMCFGLPTESQWEYACRAGSTGIFGGTGALDEMGWVMGKKPYEAGTKKPNAWGIYDMHGNVWEWCNDWLGDYPNGNITDPVGADSGERRVARGGCWRDSAERCRSARRDSDTPDARCDDVGLRLIMRLAQ